ncbi:site-specific integrase [Promicromonospora sp. NPDC023805]|uniref:tyrosine-type recombinase/integrase n=1 Tax=Promicromonospora sp. NPDC023805 TaxID=3154696 RepID=UPI0033EE3D3E
MAWTDQLASGKYRGRYRTAAGETRNAPGGPFVHKREAQLAAAAAEAESRSLGWRDPRAGGRTWREWCETWWPSRTVGTETERSDRGRRDNYLMPRWGDTRLCDITRQDVKDWAAELREPYKNAKGIQTTRASAYVRLIVGLFAASLAAAKDAEVLPTNVADKLRLPGTPPGQDRYLTRDEVGRLLAKMEPDVAVITTLLVSTGMRWGELAGLHRARVHLDRRVIDVVEAFSSKAYEMKPYPKGKKIRTVPIAEWADLTALEYVLGATDCGYTHTQGHCPGPLLLTNEDGFVLSHSRYSEAFRAAVKAAKLGHVRPHDLRHTYASWLLQGGRKLEEVGKLLGHASTSTTQRYARLTELASQEVLAALGPAPTTTPPPAPEPIVEPVDELAALRARRTASA